MLTRCWLIKIIWLSDSTLFIMRWSKICLGINLLEWQSVYRSTFLYDLCHNTLVNKYCMQTLLMPGGRPLDKFGVTHTSVMYTKSMAFITAVSSFYLWSHDVVGRVTMPEPVWSERDVKNGSRLQYEIKLHFIFQNAQSYKAKGIADMCHSKVGSIHVSTGIQIMTLT